MAIVSMNKTSIIALKKDKYAIVESLQKFGAFQVDTIRDDLIKDNLMVSPDSENEKVVFYEANITKIRYSLELIGRFYQQKKSMFTEATVYKATDKLQDIDMKKIDIIYNSCKDLEHALNEVKNDDAKILALREQLIPYIKMDIPIQMLKEYDSINIYTGYIDKIKILDFENDIGLMDNVYIECLNKAQDNSYYIIIALKTVENSLKDLFKTYNWAKYIFPDMMGTVEANINIGKTSIIENEAKRQDIVEQIKAQGEDVDFLQRAYDFLCVERDAKKIISSFAKTEKTFAIVGWVATNYLDGLKAILDDITSDYYIDSEEVLDKEGIPVLLDNPEIIKPLEMITEQYSLPNPSSIDPSRIMAPFYVMFFGMMVSDGGYGIVLALVTGLAIKFIKPKGGMKKLLGLLCLGGFSTLLWGSLFGGWFGINVKPLWFVPMNDPLKMLIFCLLFGVFQLYVGMGIQAYSSIRAGKIWDAVFDQGFFYFLYTGLMLMILPPAAAIGKVLAIIGAVGIVLTRGRSKKSIIAKASSGLMGLYGITGFLSDVLSYSRLFALGLATGVIGGVINSMAVMLGGSFIGNIAMLALLVFGHTFNIVINVFGAYVHASRLQFIEFFGKFYESGGVAFDPFKIKTKYIEIK